MVAVSSRVGSRTGVAFSSGSSLRIRPARGFVAVPRCEAALTNGNAPSDKSSVSSDAGSSQWERKSDLYILRSDGYSCNRETVKSDGSLQFMHPSSQQHLMVWKTRPKRVLVLKKLGDELFEELIECVKYIGQDQGLAVLVEPAVMAELQGHDLAASMPYLETWSESDVEDLHCYVDFVICLGGDGLVLHAAQLFGENIPPVIAFRLGSLGFLTPHEFEEFQDHLDNVINGSDELSTCRMVSSIDGSPMMGVYITLRMRLMCEVFRNGRALEGATHHVLNEIVLSRGALPYLSKIEVYERDHLITKVQADGLMLATPTGSTAYSVAAGGSMVHPNVPSILFTPICPHSLSFRPIILPDYAQLQLRIAGDARSGALATFDGKHITELLPGDSVHVRMSPHPVPTINFRDQTLDWFSSIERCFSWNDRTEQKRLNPANAATTAGTGSSAIEDKIEKLKQGLHKAA